MKQVIKIILTPSKRYKAEIIQRRDHLFEYFLYEWTREYAPDYGYVSDGYWSPITTNISLSDTEDRAVQIAIEELRLYSGEMPE
ncbi:hypothetical protein AABM38_23395 [Heyndrickxia sp. MSNUG]|uniref:hypothetical protein n=1 Tax=Heyndrickxia sp. MSNUG TaxID=3136677 RepID=UPI003C3042FD